MHGKTNKVVIPAEITATAMEVKLASKFTIDRTKWDMNYSNGVNNEVAITLNVAAKK
jgi:polyisoprenoid-binding protein YceI